MTADSSRTPALKGDLFKGLDPAELAKLQANARVMSVPAGQTIFSLGEEARTLWLISSGTVRLTLPLQLRGSTQEVTLDEKSEGAVIAWSAMVPPYKLTLGASAVSDVHLVGFEREVLERLFDEDHGVHLKMTANLNSVIANRVSLLEALVIRNLQRWVDEKLAS